MRTRITLIIYLCLLLANKASAQWTVTDPFDITQNIVNTSKNAVHTSTTATSMVKNFQETVKVYEQGKEYYDALKSVNNLAKGARKMQQTILIVGDVTDIYVTSFQRMMRDDNFTVEELGVIAFDYMKLLEESDDVLTELKNVVNITTFSMTDKKRTDVVERCCSKMKRYRNLVGCYINKGISVSYLRTKKKDNLDHIMGLYGSMDGRYWQPMEFDNLHQILHLFYEQIMSLCEGMTDVAKGIAELGALFYVAYRVWQSLTRTEPTDVFPMLRPFVVGLCIMFFPTVVLGMINNILSPVAQGTARILEAETLDMNQYREQRDKLGYETMMRNPETAYLVSNEEFGKQLGELGWLPGDVVTIVGIYIERGIYSMKKSIRDFFREILKLMFQAIALVIDTIRMFFLAVLAMLGPITFAVSVWDGFRNTLTQWICRHIQVYLRLPVLDMFSTILAKVQVLTLQGDIKRVQADPNFSLDSNNGVYIVFMIIGIVGYLTILTMTERITQAGGVGNYGRNMSQTTERVGGFAGSVAGTTAGNAMGRTGRSSKQHSGTCFLCRRLGRLLSLTYTSLVANKRKPFQTQQE